jgi:protein involved in polysaccharide export with SLBB domain
MVRVLAPAVLQTVQTNKRWLKVSMVSVFGGLVGIIASLGLILLVELKDNRLRSVDDLERVTQLPILTTLGDLQGMDGPERNQWAFRTWTMLQGKLSPSANHGLVCGITSSTTGEGRSTWISLLAEAASLTGFRVLTIATKASPTHVQTPAEPADEAASEDATADKAPSEDGPAEQAMPDPTAFGEASSEKREMHPAKTAQNGNTNGSALAGNVLTSPSSVTEQLTGPNSQPVVHIPLPGWVWNLDRRKQWGEALNHWRMIDNLVILVELPPADVPEAVLLGSNLPNLVWLTDSGTADAGETRAQLETLRHARCNLVGAVLNREPSVPLKKRFPRWMGCVVAGLALGLGSAQAQDDTKVNTPPTTETRSNAAVPDATTTAPAETQTNVSFSIVHPAQRAAWQQHLTVGPGDVLNLGLYGQPEFTLTEVSIPSDGRLNYLEARDVLTTGLTIDELRAKFDEELAKFRRAPHTIITPVAFRSKRYYMLGKVMTKGVYVLDRPITVLEAIARAHGLENGLVDRNVIDLADFQRSFLVRGGKRFPLNFEKLFQDGDLAQNIPIEPGDYIYFPSTVIKEVYVVGEVRLPGAVSYHPSTTIMAAISARGGYTDRAYKARVLVVRGSINHPETFAVDTHAILDAKAPDFKLQPRDIIYVNSRPFIRVEELADLATTAFIQSLITSWVGVDIVKPINQ